MNFLGIDPAKNSTGVCLIEEMGEGRAPRLTVSNFSCSTPKGAPDRDFKTCLLMSDHLYDYLIDLRKRGIRIDVAALETAKIYMGTRTKVTHDLAGRHEEEVSITDPRTLHLLAMLSGTIIDILHRFKIRTQLVETNTWRGFCIGRTRAPVGTPVKERSGWAKKETRRWATDLGLRYGFKISNDDQSDAVGIGLYSAIHHGDSMDVRKMLATRRVAA